MEDRGLEQLPTYDHRPGVGPTLVFLHYWGGSAGTWRDVLDRLPGRNTIAIDFRGWGRSRDLSGQYTLEQYGRDVLAVIAEAGIDEFVLVGHSMGGKVAQLVAAERPAGLVGVVLVAPAPPEPPAGVTAEYREHLSHAYDTDESVRTVLSTVLTASPLDAETVMRVVTDSRASPTEARLEWPLRGIAQNITEQARRIDVPVLVVMGERDQVEPPEVLRDSLLPYLGEATAITIDDAGHLLPLEAPNELAAAITSFEAGLVQQRT